MGGRAFASGLSPLLTPRMPTEVYLKIRSQHHEILSKYYTFVATPIEAPCKQDYGDVDFLVAGETSFSNGLDFRDTLSKALGAERSIRHSGSVVVNFAVPWPEDYGIEDPNSYVDEADGRQKRYVQVDVHVCKDKPEWEWELFHHAHGDLWNILGSTIRKHGLTVNNRGFYLRAEEIDLIDRRKSMILLTKKPSEVLNFLGLDERQWWKPFQSNQEMFEYAASCRFFWAEEIDQDKKELKHNDRKRMNQRPIFAMWIEKFIPERRATGTYGKELLTREEIKDEALDRFGVKDQYKQRIEAFRLERKVDEIWRMAIKAGVPTEDVDPQFRGAAIRGLKAIVIQGDLRSGIAPAKPLRTEDGSYDMEQIIEFIRGNWQQVGDVEFEREQKWASGMINDREIRKSVASSFQLIPEPSK